MDAKSLTSKEIQFNIMVALMQISGSLSDLVTQGEVCDYGEITEVSADEPTRLNK